MLNISQEIQTLISAASGIATIIASVLALATIFVWRKQQRYSLMFNAIMDLEDNYEILMCEYYIKYNWFFQRFKLASEANDQTKEYRSAVDEKIKSDYIDFKSNDKLAISQNNYQLAYARANRFDISLDTYETLSYAALDDFFQKNVLTLNRDAFKNQSTIDDEMHRFSENFCSFKNAGLSHFKIIRDTM